MSKSIVNKKIINIGEKVRAATQFDIPYKIDRFDALSTLFEKKQMEIGILCHNLYKQIVNV